LCSVPCATFWHSSIHRSSSNVIFTTELELLKFLRHILNFELLSFLVHYIHMGIEKFNENRLKKSRFGSIIFLLRLAGIPIKTQKVSTIYAIYMRTVIFFSCASFLGTFVDAYIHRDDLEHTIQDVSLLIPMSNNLWIYIYCRYVRTLTITFSAPQVFL
jgi:hypothetical protein